MSDATPRSAARQLRHDDGLPFEELLPDHDVRLAFQDNDLPFRNSLYNPAVTLWIFLSQCLDPLPCLRKAVARFHAFRSARGLSTPTADPSGYNKARHRLPQSVLIDLTRQTGYDTEDQAQERWLWNGRRVHVVDGTTLSMPDSPDNQQHYPQPRSQRPGLGFPIVRLVVLFSLAVGTVLEAALAPYRGKGTGETALFGQLLNTVFSGDVVLGDRYYCTFWLLAALRQRGADAVFRLHAGRSADLRRGWRIGPEDRYQMWHRPQRPAWMDAAEYEAVPAWIVVRVFRQHVRRPGFRSRAIEVATTLLDTVRYSRSSIGSLYRRRWQAELNLRALKSTLNLDVLRGQSAAVVRLELWAHLLAYNLIRRAMTRSAAERKLDPLGLSFAGAVQTVLEYVPHLLVATEPERRRLWLELEEAIAQHRVGNRPDRVEPRVVKRRPKPYKRMTAPRKHDRTRSEHSASV